MQGFSEGPVTREAIQKKSDAEIALANYDALIQIYLDNGEFEVDDTADKARRSVAAVLELAQEAGADIGDLNEQWMQISARVLDARRETLQ
jgi:hypothetical protein